VTFFLGGRAVAVAMGLLGVVAVLVGLIVGTNVNGGADALAEATKSYRPLGVDSPDPYCSRRGSPDCSA
jgi:hypothetical protein